MGLAHSCSLNSQSFHSPVKLTETVTAIQFDWELTATNQAEVKGWMAWQ